ncbi:MAG: enolase C-terminal domain-like protein [Elusimicrobiota bacterium]
MNTRFIVTESEVIPYSLPLRITFGTAQGKKVNTNGVLIRINNSEGKSGLCECVTATVFKEQSIDVITRTLNRICGLLKNTDSREYPEIARRLRRRFPSQILAVSTAERALAGLMLNVMNVPAYKYFGAKLRRVVTDVTIPIAEIEEITPFLRKMNNAGFYKYKIKVCRDIDWDIFVIKHIIETNKKIDSSKNYEYSLDGNQGFVYKTAVELLMRLRKENLITKLAYLEQPLQRHDYRGLEKLNRQDDILIAVDESVITPVDAQRVADNNLASIINIKLAKSGYSQAQEIVSIAKKEGIKLMIGCMTESSIGLASSVHFACGTGVFKYIDLDGHLLVKEKRGSYGFTAKGPGLTV